MKKMIFEIAQLNPLGFTFNLQTMELYNPPKGFAVAFEETQGSFGIEGLERAINHALNNENFVGGWLEEGKYYFDSVKIFKSEKEAVKFAIENEQIAYFDFEKGIEQRLK